MWFIRTAQLFKLASSNNDPYVAEKRYRKKIFYRAMCAVGSKINVSVLGLEVDGSALCSPHAVL